MLLVKTYIAASKIDGVGLFAAEPIERGTIVSYFTTVFDCQPLDTGAYPEVCENFLHKYSFLIAGHRVLFSDHARFINHRNKANLVYKERSLAFQHLFFAIEDTPSGTELTIDYETFDVEHYKRVCSFIERRDAKHWPPKVKID
jgi:SET domain-containing protein